MNKGFLKFLLKIIILILIIYGIFVIIIKKFGMYIFDEEYAFYKQTMNYVNDSNKYNHTLIFGDSVAKAGVIPELISNETYNLAMAGATPIEQYYLMNDYLENHEKPKTIVMMYFIGAYDTIDDFFWNRTVYFDCLETDQFREIMANGAFEKNDEAYFRFLEYKFCSPRKYYSALKNATLENRYNINKISYENSVKSKGQHYFGTASSYNSDNVTITLKEHFEVLEVIEKYLYKCIEQCRENDIQVIIEQHPMNTSTYANMKENFRNEYQKYMRELQAKYPEIIVNCEYNVRDNTWFGDFAHLNQNGATIFSTELVQKYAEYFK